MTRRKNNTKDGYILTNVGEANDQHDTSNGIVSGRWTVAGPLSLRRQVCAPPEPAAPPVTGTVLDTNGAVQVVTTLHSVSSILIGDDTFVIREGGVDVQHALLVAYDGDGNVVWRIHARTESDPVGKRLRQLYQEYSYVLLDAEGNAYISFRVGDQGGGGGGPFDYDFGLVGEDGTTLVTSRIYTDFYSSLTDMLMKITPEGKVAWVSRCLSLAKDQSPTTYTADGGDNGCRSMVFLDSGTIGVVMGRMTYGGGFPSGVNEKDTATFMPDTDGTYTQEYYLAGENWFVQIDTASGTVKQQPERLHRDIHPLAGAEYWYNFNRVPGLAISDSSSYCAWAFEAYPNAQYHGYLYRAETQATNPETGDAPSPGYPTNMRFEVFPQGAGALQNSSGPYANILVRDGIQGNPRYAVRHEVRGGSNANFVKSLDGGCSKVSGSDDFLWAYSNWSYDNPNVAGAEYTTHLVSDRQEQGYWKHDISNLSPSFYNDVVRFGDNPASASVPNINWITRFDAVSEYAANATNGAATEYWRTAPRISSVDDVWAIGMSPTSNANITPLFRRVDPSIIDTLGPLDFAPANPGINYGASVLMAGKQSDGTPLWYQVMEQGAPSAVTLIHSIHKKGREFWVLLTWKHKMYFDPGGPDELVLDPPDSSTRTDLVRYDITNGTFKGRVELHDGNAAMNRPGGVREGYCDVRDDIPNTAISIGVPMSTPALVVDNANGDITITNVGDSLSGSGMTLDSSGSISGIPTSVGPFDIVLKAEDESQDFSYSNRFRLGSAPTVGAYPNFSETVLTAMTPFTPTGSGSEFRIVQGFLPDGVSLNTASGEISGTPTGDSLLYDAGDGLGVYNSIIVEVDRLTQAAPFNYVVDGVVLPTPDLYWDGDSTHDEELTPITASTDSGTKKYVTGTVANAMDFDGSDLFSYGTGVLQPGSGSFSFSCHMNWHGNGGVYRAILNEREDATNYVYFGSRRFYIYGPGGQDGFDGTRSGDYLERFASRVWVREAGVELRGYLDGSPDGSTAESAGALLPSGSGTLKIADESGHGLGNNLTADIDEMAYWRGSAFEEAEAVTIEWLRRRTISLKTYIGF